MDNCIITSASNKFFPSLINLLGSIKKIYHNHPRIYVYDLGLFSIFRKEIEAIEGVTVLEVPHFVKYWRSCYTWKTYILNNPLAENNFYIDAGCQILRSLDNIFNKINNNGYLLVGVGKENTIRKMTPSEYIGIFNLDSLLLDSEPVTAGIFGFKRGSAKIKEVTQLTYEAGVAGLCLGFSKKDSWRNKGKDKNYFIRDCEMFRHDTTLLSIFSKKIFGETLIMEKVQEYSDKLMGGDQYIWNLRLSYKKLNNSEIFSNRVFIGLLNRLILKVVIFIKNLNLVIKKFFKII